MAQISGNFRLLVVFENKIAQPASLRNKILHYLLRNKTDGATAFDSRPSIC